MGCLHGTDGGRLRIGLAAAQRPFSRSVLAVGEVEPTVEDAVALAARLHRGARYPSPEAEPYVLHPLRVMLRFTDPVDQAAAVLHDVVEDTEITLDDLRDAGYKPEVVDAIDALTHHTHESYEQYIDRVTRNSIARRVKIADLEENLANNRIGHKHRGSAIPIAVGEHHEIYGVSRAMFAGSCVLKEAAGPSTKVASGFPTSTM